MYYIYIALMVSRVSKIALNKRVRNINLRTCILYVCIIYRAISVYMYGRTIHGLQYRPLIRPGTANTLAVELMAMETLSDTVQNMTMVAENWTANMDKACPHPLYKRTQRVSAPFVSRRTV